MGWELLKCRRIIAKLSLFYKLGLVSAPSYLKGSISFTQIPIHQTMRSTGRDRAVNVPFCRLEASKNFFFLTVRGYGMIYILTSLRYGMIYILTSLLVPP